MYSLIILTCMAGVEEPNTNCVGYNSRDHFETEEECLSELAEDATNWATRNGLAIHDFQCVYWASLAPEA